MAFDWTNPMASLGNMLYAKLFGGQGTPSSRIQAPTAPSITGPTTYAYTNLDANKPTADQEALQRLQQLRSALLQQSASLGNMGQMSSQASISANLQYDPQIAQIQSLMAQAKKTTRGQQRLVTSTYNDLAKMSKVDVADAKKEAAAASEGEKARLADLKTNIKSDYMTSMNSLRDELQQLGIQAAGGDAMGDLSGDMALYQRLGSQESAAEQQAINTREQGDISYFSKQAPIARMAGAEQVGQLSQALQQYLFQQQGQLGQLQAQKQLAYQSAMNQLQGQVSSQQNDIWNKLQQLSRQEKSLTTPKKFGQGLTGASDYLTQQFSSGYDSQFGLGEAKRYLGVLQGLITSAGSQPYRLTPEQLVNQAAVYARQHGISERILTRAMLTYLGKG